MAHYMLLLYDDPARFSELSADEMQRIIEKYIAWRQRLQASGHLVSSNKLADDAGRTIRREGGGLRITDGPYSESKEVLGGYFILEAADYDEAVERSRDCPHFEYGTVVLRRVDAH